MILLPSCFCPSVGYLSLLAASEGGAGIYTGERYQKQTLRNRALFLTAGGVTPFTVPVAKYGYPAPPASEILISEHGAWRHRLEQTLRSGYGAAPFWDHYEEEIMTLIWDKEHTRLVDYNHLWLALLCGKWDIPVPDLMEKKPETTGEGDLVLSPETLAALPMKRYWQVFEAEQGFVPGLSALDLLLCEGPYAVTCLLETAAQNLPAVLRSS